MTERNEILKLVNEELEEANKKNGLFVDAHQAHSVIREELEETIEELMSAVQAFCDMWEAVKNDDEDAIFEAADRGYHDMLYAIAEGIQACAMFKKATDTLGTNRTVKDLLVIVKRLAEESGIKVTFKNNHYDSLKRVSKCHAEDYLLFHK